jgi:5-deoxy-glucuronate isomerase
MHHVPSGPAPNEARNGPGMNKTRPAATRSLLHRAAAPGPDGLVVAVDRAAAGWDFAELAVYRLRAGQDLARSADDSERVVLVLEGHAAVQAGEQDFGRVGSRQTVFDGPPPPVILVAPGEPVVLTAATDALIAIAGAPGGPVSRTALLRPEEILVETRGSGQTERRVHHLLPPEAEAGRLIAFEVFTPGGNW